MTLVLEKTPTIPSTFQLFPQKSSRIELPLDIPRTGFKLTARYRERTPADVSITRIEESRSRIKFHAGFEFVGEFEIVRASVSCQSCHRSECARAHTLNRYFYWFPIEFRHKLKRPPKQGCLSAMCYLFRWNFTRPPTVAASKVHAPMTTNRCRRYLKLGNLTLIKS